jgi:hypothetical protein
MVNARALLRGNPDDRVGYVEADVREPEEIVRGAAGKLDFTQPVAIMLLRILGHITDDGQAQSIVNRLLDFVPSGSYLVLSDGTDIIS